MSMTEELPESELGTQEYWNSLYKTEINNFKDHGDVGEIWFGESVVNRIVKWMEKNVAKTLKVLDVGCGNGMLLVELHNRGFKSLIGLDYSADAIVLAKEVCLQYKAEDIQLIVGDVLRLDHEDVDVVIDKGTYDAISLSSDAANKRKNYLTSIEKCLHANGLLVITSCNWTKEELIQHFTSESLVFSDEIPMPQFKFGGTTGSAVSSVIFKRIQC